MKLLVFAHVPPPHHGQSFMVKLMIDGFRAHAATAAPGDRIEVFHVNARFSSGLQDVGGFRAGKVAALVRFCGAALWMRFRHGVRALYYVPAPPRRTPLCRDWLIMALCRPLFDVLILHWEAVGLGEWIEAHGSASTRWLTRKLLGQADLAVVLSGYNRADAAKLQPRQVAVVSNGIPDPCPDFVSCLLQRRRARWRVRQSLLAGCSPDEADLSSAGTEPYVVRVLFLAHCTREKGVFAAMEAVALANYLMEAQNRALRFRLTAAGEFVDSDQQHEFDERSHSLPEHSRPRCPGFVDGPQKTAVFQEADLFCFPSQYHAEGQPVCLLEAMAFGLPVVATRWRGIPELFPPDYPGLADDQDPQKLSALLIEMATHSDGTTLRSEFLRSLTDASYIAGLRRAFLTLGAAPAVDVKLPEPAEAPGAGCGSATSAVD